MRVAPDEWRRLWADLGAAQANGGLFNQLVAAHSEAQRHYHTLQHLRECLAHCEAAASLARRPAEVAVALWFHDAIYDPQRADNEQRSADWARAALAAAGCAPEAGERVAAMILATQAHQPSADADTQLLLDIDLAILGASPERFAEYGRQVRAEYAHVPDERFREGRARVLAAFLAGPRIYGTPAFHDALEQRARANLGDALAGLGEN